MNNPILLLLLAVTIVGFVSMAILYFRCVDRYQLEEEEHDMKQNYSENMNSYISSGETKDV